MNKLLIVLASIVLVSCTSNSGIRNYQSKGNLESTSPLKCMSITELKPVYNPVDIFVGMKKCLDTDNYSSAAAMYYAAMTYGIYDTQRVRDRTSHQGIIVLRMNVLSGLSEQQIAFLQSEINTILESNDRVCEALSVRGLPTYHPTYMIQHGMETFTGGHANNGLVENFDSHSAWSQALEKTVKCGES